MLNRLGIVIGSALLSLAVVAGPVQAFEPSEVQCIAPAGPGGGWDFTCRSVGKLLYEMGAVPNPVQVRNMPGGDGAVAFGHVISEQNSDDDLLIAASTVGIAQIAQGLYPGKLADVRWVGMLGADIAAVLVRKDSSFNSLGDFLAAMKADPSSVNAGGSTSIGGWDHVRLMLLANAAGLDGEAMRDIRWVYYEGGGPAVTQMLGGHVDVIVTDFSEVAGFVQSGDVKVLGVLSAERMAPPYANLPTAREQGYDVAGLNWRGFYLGGQASEDAFNGWTGLLKSLYDTDEWKTVATNFGLIPMWMGGTEFEAFVQKTEDDMKLIYEKMGLLK